MVLQRQHWRWLSVAALVCLIAVVVQRGVSNGLHKKASLGPAGSFLFGCLETDIVGYALPAAYFRIAVPGHAQESRLVGCIAAAVVGVAALVNIRLYDEESVDNFSIVLGVLAASYAFSSRLIPTRGPASAAAACCTGAVVALVVHQGWVYYFCVLAMGLATASVGGIIFNQQVSKGRTIDKPSVRWPVVAVTGVLGLMVVPHLASFLLNLLLPIRELSEAYRVIGDFIGMETMYRNSQKIVLVTAFCQVSLGYLGIAFLRRGQERKNALINVGEGRITAREYANLVGVYMIAAALPYMLQRTVVENVNSYVALHIERSVERTMRVGSYFPPEDSGSNDLLLAAIHGSKYTVEGYTDAFNAMGSVIYNTVESKFFTLPKLLLLPSMLASQPWLVISVLPLSIFLDLGRSRLTTTFTKRIEGYRRAIEELANRRRKIEQHDSKNEELIRRGASTGFVGGVWHEVAVKMEGLSLRYHSLVSLRAFINGLYRQDFLVPGIEIVLAYLLQFRQIPVTDIWVYTRVVEDTIDFLLTRFRMDATLANLKTNTDRVTDLKKRLDTLRSRRKASCTVNPAGGAIHISGLRYTRGTALEVVISELTLRRGRIYAVTGPNGSGKSTLFGILASCGKAATMLPDGLKLLEPGSIDLPSDNIIEITQQLYCPLYIKPLAWMLQQRNLQKLSAEELAISEQRIGNLTQELEFHRKDDGASGKESGLTQEELNEEKEDWYDTLSGGQRGKIEFIRKVFLHKHCPGVLLIDEAFAPLDPRSKKLVQQKLKEFCTDSVILVIYHGGAGENCVPSDGFFDESLQFGNGTAKLTPTC